mmetsp:Transcript_5572/g.13960  ORF Transcript_5572/g.13960 Transcript_5572/m.13960 type:complete len:307 (+) Transcript_5572:218-1138(+)
MNETTTCVHEEKSMIDVKISSWRRSRRNRKRLQKKGRGNILIILPVSKGLICTRDFTLRIASLLLGEGFIILIIVVCMEGQEVHHPVHTPILMHIITIAETLALLMIIFVDLIILITIIRCHPCRIQVNLVTMAEEMGFMHTHQICLVVPGLLLVITQTDMEGHTLVLYHIWGIMAPLLHHHIMVHNRLLTQIQFHLLGVRDQTSLTHQMDREKREQSKAFMIGPRINLFPYHILFEGQIVVRVIVLRQLVRLWINLLQSHQTSARGRVHVHQTIFHRCRALQIYLKKAIDHLFNDHILEIRQHRV